MVEGGGKGDDAAEVMIVLEKLSALPDQHSAFAALFKEPWVKGLIAGGFLIGSGVAGYYLMRVSHELIRHTESRSQVNQIGRAMMIYAEDYDRTLPPANSWQDVLHPYIGQNKYIWTPPRIQDMLGYGFNGHLGGRNLDEIGPRNILPMLHEVRSARPNPLADPANPIFIRRKTLVGFADGETKLMSPEEYARLDWSPKPLNNLETVD